MLELYCRITLLHYFLMSIYRNVFFLSLSLSLFQCFGSDGKLILHYCNSQAWGWTALVASPFLQSTSRHAHNVVFSICIFLSVFLYYIVNKVLWLYNALQTVFLRNHIGLLNLSFAQRSCWSGGKRKSSNHVDTLVHTHIHSLSGIIESLVKVTFA